MRTKQHRGTARLQMRTTVDTGAGSLLDLAENGAEGYCRARHLPRLIPLWSQDLADTSVEGRQRIVACLRRSLRAERRRGKAGHWSYDLNRHMALLIALKSEVATLGVTRNRT